MGYKILLADDSVTVQKIITLTFSDEGVDVITVNNGNEAISRLQYMRPALVMADVSIPGKNGYEICEFVKNHPDMKDTPVVLLVPSFEPFDEERARRIGVDRHLTKPFQSIRPLVTTVKTLLEGHPPKFATGSLNPPSSQLQTPEPVKSHAAFAEAAPVVQPVHIRETQPFPDEPEKQVDAVAEATEVIETAEAPQIWKEEPVPEVESIWRTDPVGEAPQIWKTEPVEEIKPALEIETQTSEVILETEPVLAIEEPLPVLIAPEPEPIIEQATVIEAVTPIVEVPVVVEEKIEQVAAPRINTGDLDHVLELDDVLGWPPTPHVAAPPVVAAPVLASVATETTIPQNIIDEIVNRVVAQLSEKLTLQLVSQIAPEVAELVKQQVNSTFPGVVTNKKEDSELLLDLD